MMREAAILGYSGHGYVVLDILLSNNYKIKSCFDKTQNQHNLYQLTYLGSENDLSNLETLRQYDIFIVIGSNEISS